MTNAKRDQNYIPVMLGVSSVDETTTLPVLIDPVTGKVLVQGTGVSGVLDMVKVYQTAATTLIDATWTTLSFGAETFDSNTMHDNSVNPSRITIKTTGTYMIGGSVMVAENAVSGFKIFFNGAVSSVLAVQKQGNSGNPESCGLSTIVQLSAGDYIEAQAFADAGLGSYLTSGDANTNFWAILLSA